MSARKTYTASEALRVDELRAEARAWRRAAELLDAGAPGIIGLATASARAARHSGAAEDSMVTRRYLHAAAFGSAPIWDVDDWTSCLVLACLFLALECEDEARALGRGKTPDRRSAR